MAGDVQDEEPWLPGAPTWDDDWDRLADTAYAGARDGILSPETAFDLAVFLKNWAKPHPVVDALAEASVEATDGAAIAALAREALAIVEYLPGFRVEPRLLDLVTQSIDEVAHDLRATGLTGTASAVLTDDVPNVWLRYQGSFGHTSGISPGDVTEDGPELLVRVADELQDAVMAALMAVWPVCPRHQPGAHPTLFDGNAVWWCADRSGHVISSIGQWET